MIFALIIIGFFRIPKCFLEALSDLVPQGSLGIFGFLLVLRVPEIILRSLVFLRGVGFLRSFWVL